MPTPKSARRVEALLSWLKYTTEDILTLRWLMPRGAIVAWHGLRVAVPRGWVLCDGSNSTPDLRGRFLRGAAAGADPGTTGGSDTHTHDDHAAHTHDDASELAAPQLFTRDPAGVSARTGNPSSTLTHSTSSSLPLYYEVLWIMKL